MNICGKYPTILRGTKVYRNYTSENKQSIDFALRCDPNLPEEFGPNLTPEEFGPNLTPEEFE